MPTALASAGISLFGTAASSAINRPDDSAQRAQQAQNAQSQRFIEEQALKAENSAGRLFDNSARNLLAGNSAAMSVYKDAINPQMNTLNQGYQNAQQQISVGLPQIQNALMGLPVDYSAFQPRNVTPDLSFMDSYKINTAAAGSPEHQAQQGHNMIMQQLGLPQQNFGVTFSSPSQALAMTPEEQAAAEQRDEIRSVDMFNAGLPSWMKKATRAVRR